jgi:DNA-binding beta-propeller fold protein YncE
MFLIDRSRWLMLLLAAALPLHAGAAIMPVFDSSFDTGEFTEPEGVGYDPISGLLFVGDGATGQILTFNPDGTASGFNPFFVGTTDPRGIEFRADNNHLLVSGKDTFGGVREFELSFDSGTSTITATQVTAGDCNTVVDCPFNLASAGSDDPEGVVLHPFNNNVYVTDNGTNIISEFVLNAGVGWELSTRTMQEMILGTPSGIMNGVIDLQLLLFDESAMETAIGAGAAAIIDLTLTGVSPDGTAVVPGTPVNTNAGQNDPSALPDPIWVPAFRKPGGISVDPGTGNLIVVDDSSGRSTGFIWELTVDGRIIAVHHLGTVSGTDPLGPYNDGEGVTYFDDGAGGLFLMIAVENEHLVSKLSFDTQIPEPATAALLLLGLAGLVRRRA